MRYPSGYFPRDALKNVDEPFDWNGDHIHTNFHVMYDFLVSRGYTVEVLGEPFYCFNASDYGHLLLVDPEDEFLPEEISKLEEDVKKKSLNLIVFADWYDEEVMKQSNYFDENTHSWWVTATGGSNVPALNDLLSSFEISLAGKIYDGFFKLESHVGEFASGSVLHKFPEGGLVFSFEVKIKGNHV